MAARVSAVLVRAALEDRERITELVEKLGPLDGFRIAIATDGVPESFPSEREGEAAAAPVAREAATDAAAPGPSDRADADGAAGPAAPGEPAQRAGPAAGARRTERSETAPSPAEELLAQLSILNGGQLPSLDILR
ncbi:MAG TPA: hypothetical protein VFR34_04210 [Paracoccaceae bacterium]|nr:hypothetical protein [Paracoccaceae bacterium]